MRIRARNFSRRTLGKAIVSRKRNEFLQYPLAYTTHSLLPHQMSGMFVLGEHSLDGIHSLLQLIPRWAKGQANKVMTRRVEQVSLDRTLQYRTYIVAAFTHAFSRVDVKEYSGNTYRLFLRRNGIG